MKNLDEIEKIIKTLLGFVDGKVESLMKQIKVEISAKIDDRKDLAKLEEAIELMLKLEKRELHDEQRVQDAFKLIVEQQRQISLLNHLEKAVKDVSKKPELFGEIERSMNQLEESLEKEVAELR